VQGDGTAWALLRTLGRLDEHGWSKHAHSRAQRGQWQRALHKGHARETFLHTLRVRDELT
jgi:hypothetical protein